MVGVTIPVPQYPLTTTLTLLPNHSLIPDNSKLTLPALLSSVLYNTLEAVEKRLEEFKVKMKEKNKTFNYVLTNSDGSEEYVINDMTGYTSTDNYIYLSVKGNCFKSLSGSTFGKIDYHMKPKKEIRDKFFNNLTDFQNVLLDRLQTPKYKITSPVVNVINSLSVSPSLLMSIFLELPSVVKSTGAVFQPACGTIDLVTASSEVPNEF